MKATILLVEDNPESRYLFGFILRRTGAEVQEAGNGLEALEAVRNLVPDLIIMDIQMPEMDGYETVAHMRQDPRLAATPIVGLSAYAMSSDREKALKSGFNGYIEKPIEIPNFLQELSAYLPELARQ
jgi:CheY-like chemotaxis protein